MCFSTQKMHFKKNGNLTPCPAQPSVNVKELFLEGNFTPILESKQLRNVEEKCPGNFDSSKFCPFKKCNFFEDLKKSI